MLRSRFTGRKEYFGSVFFDHSTGELYPFDPLGTALLDALARHAPSEVTAAFSQVDGGVDAAGIESFLEEWRVKGLLDAYGRPNTRMLPDLSQEGGLSAPLRVYLDFTSACNLRCLHCVTRSGKRQQGELDTRQFRVALDRLAEAGVFEINVGGGEPLIRPDAVDLLQHACDLGMSVAMTTNGTRIDARTADALGSLPLRYVAISLDGASAGTHDAIRGRGRFQRTLAGIRHLARRTSLHLNVHFTLMRHNLHELEAFFTLAAQLPVDSMGVLPLRPCGRARENEWLHLSPEQYGNAAWSLQALTESSQKPVFHIPFMPTSEVYGPTRMYRGFGCGAAQVTCSMDATGHVVPCNFFEDPGPRESILEKNLQDIWREGPFFVRLRTLEGNPTCLGCTWFEDCRGGCRAQAVGAFADINAPDCYCLSSEAD